MSTIIDAARSAYQVGLVVLPVANDGSKRPDVASWRAFQTRQTTLDEWRSFAFHTRNGFGVVAGPVSTVDCWDFDTADVFDAFVTTAQACGLSAIVDRIRAGYEDQTPGGGRRWIVRYPPSVEWHDSTLARRPGRTGEPVTKTLIELPTFAILAPSNGQTHPSGRPYVRVSGDFTTIASYNEDERDALIELARSFDELPRSPATRHGPRARERTGSRPGDDYGTRTTWRELLESHGWTLVFDRGDESFWRRPGKTHGVSATTNFSGSDLFYVFTSSTAFDPEKSYTRFAAYAVLKHNGDFAAAARALGKAGYGAQPESEPESYALPAVPLVPGDALLAPLADRPYTGWFARGAVHLVAGSSGAGKTSMMLALLRAQRRGEAYFGHLGQRHDFLVLFCDRGHVSNNETLERLRIDPETMPVAYLPATAGGPAALAAIRLSVEAHDELPAAVFVEGADMLVEDASKTHVVAQFVTGLRRLAEHYGLAIVLSVGSPKARPHEQYQHKRDQVFGSQAWSRLADTVCVLSVTADGTEATRDLVVLHRNAAAEKFHLAFVDGLLVPIDQPATTQDMVSWFRKVEVFTKQRFRDAFKLSGARATELLDGYVTIGTLRKKKLKHDRTHYLYREPRASKSASVSDPFSDTFQASAANAETVRKTTGHGHGPDPELHEFPNVLETNPPIPTVPPFSCPLSESDVSQGRQTDNGHGFGGIRAREADDLPACLATLVEQDARDPIGAHDELDRAVAVQSVIGFPATGASVFDPAGAFLCRVDEADDWRDA